VILLVSCAGLLLVGPPLAADSKAWNAEYLQSDSDWPQVYPNDVNERGKITGFWQGADGIHAIVWSDPDSAPAELDALEGDTNNWAADVNGRGTVCGTSGGGWPLSRAVIWDGKNLIHDRQPADWGYSDLWSLNESDEGAGSVWDDPASGWPFWACYWSAKGEAVVLDDGGCLSTWAISINKNGRIAGQSYPDVAEPPFVRACYWDGTSGDLVDVHDAVESAAGEDLYYTLAYEVTDDDEVVGFAYTLADFRMIAWVYSDDEGVTILDDGATGTAFAWQSAGKWVIGGIGGDPGFNGTPVAAVWERGTKKGTTTWTLHPITSLADTEMIAVGVNKEGNLVGAAQAADGTVRAWYAKRAGK
jgi:hypothetical protein